ncbi:MAG: hypothetical protein Q7R30_25215 [Acidobacteriota bacterium]|nr:hypothetical protein [Acidobacteriota bacterium]
MNLGRRRAIVMLLGILSAVVTAPAIGQVLPEGFTSRTAADQGGGLTGYDAAGNLYLYREAGVTSSGQATLERISPNGDRTALSVPLQYGQDMAVAQVPRRVPCRQTALEHFRPIKGFVVKESP